MRHPIATARRARNWTQEALARQVGVSRGAVAQWEMLGGTRPAPEQALKLADLLGLSLSEIYAPNSKRAA
jgi:DNA-binding XRE family transcriptional regulator